MLVLYYLIGGKDMKEWKKPQLFSLGVEHTYTGEDGSNPIHAFGTHFCHGKPGTHNGNCEQGSGHTPTNTGDCKVHTSGTPNHEEYSCCCLGIS